MITSAIIITIIVEVIKRAEILDKKYLPLASIIIGGIVALFIDKNVLQGIVEGAAAIGLYETIKSPLIKKRGD